MGFISLLSRFLSISQVPLSEVSIEPFSLEAWLPKSALHQQAVLYYPTSKTSGYFGIEIQPEPAPAPHPKVAIFTREATLPENLFKTSDDQDILSVIVQYSGEVEYNIKTRVGGEFDPYSGNFSTDYFTYWPDQKSYDFLDFKPPGFLSGVFLACPGVLGEDEVKGYRLYAMTPLFQHGGCITLEFLVLSGSGKN